MSNKELKNYIIRSKQIGKNNELIRQELLNVGWPVDVVGSELKSLESLSEQNKSQNVSSYIKNMVTNGPILWAFLCSVIYLTFTYILFIILPVFVLNLGELSNFQASEIIPTSVLITEFLKSLIPTIFILVFPWLLLWFPCDSLGCIYQWLFILFFIGACLVFYTIILTIGFKNLKKGGFFSRGQAVFILSIFIIVFVMGNIGNFYEIKAKLFLNKALSILKSINGSSYLPNDGSTLSYSPSDRGFSDPANAKKVFVEYLNKKPEYFTYIYFFDESQDSFPQSICNLVEYPKTVEVQYEMRKNIWICFKKFDSGESLSYFAGFLNDDKTVYFTARLYDNLYSQVSKDKLPEFIEFYLK